MKEQLDEKNMNFKVLILDVDGVMTTGQFLYFKRA